MLLGTTVFGSKLLGGFGGENWEKTWKSC